MSVATPTTGYDDVKQVALARLLADNIAVDPGRLAAVRPEARAGRADRRRRRRRRRAAVEPGRSGTRRSPLEEIRGNIRAAGLEPVERNGRFEPIARRDARMRPVRLGAVGYLNARPLVYGLELRSDLFALRFDVPSKCAALLHEGAIDVGMIPSIEYLRGPRPYRIVPGLGDRLGRAGGVGRALHARSRSTQIRSIALDTSSRTSVALLRVLCRERVRHRAGVRADGAGPGRDAARCDAALLIGDPALFLDHERAGRRRRSISARSGRR